MQKKNKMALPHFSQKKKNKKNLAKTLNTWISNEHFFAI